MKQVASDVVARVVTEIDPRVNVRVDPKARWESLGVVPEEAELVELIGVYRSIHPLFRPHVISTVWTQARFPQCKRLTFLASVIRDEQSL